MTTVRPFEADLLRLLHAILGRGPVDRAVEIVLASRPRPKCLGREALGLIEDTLAKGCIRRLARTDGWRRERFLRGDRVVEGRLWERTSPEALGLTFSGQSLELLIRLVAEDPWSWAPTSGPPPEDSKMGDAILSYFVFETLRGTKFAAELAKLPLVESASLCRLAFPSDFAGLTGLGDPDFTPWLEPSRSWLLEALQTRLAAAWVASELGKRKVAEPGRVATIAREQARVLDGFCSSVDASGRRDLARFLLRACRELLQLGSGLRDWVGALDLQGMRLADRAEGYRAALGVLRVLERFQGWEREARGVGYFDEGYAAAQLWKSDWERLGGEELRGWARSLIRSADPLAAGV